MQFKLWLETTENAYSWLSPSGEFIPMGQGGHLLWAIKYLKDNDPMPKMFKLKWQRIQFFSKTLYTQNDYYGPDFKQKEALIDLAITNKFDEIKYENNADEFTIWSKNDIL